MQTAQRKRQSKRFRASMMQNVSSTTQKMTVDAEDDKFDDIKRKEVVSVCAKVEPDCKILM